MKHVWPLIVQHITKLIATGLKNLSASISDAVKARMNARAKSAESQAKAAEAAAQAATTDAERVQQEAFASVWRQVAEQFRAENESLRAQVAELTEKSQESLANEVRAGEPSLGGLDGNPFLTIGLSEVPLPALPYKSAEL